MKTPFTNFIPRWVGHVAMGLTVTALIFTGCGKSDSGPARTDRKVIYYQSAMHPWIKSDKPGRCTICGMELTPVYEGEAGREVGGDIISLSESSVRVLNVQTTEVKTQALTKTLKVAGTIEQDDTRRRVLSAYVGGRIDKLHVGYVGADVTAGTPLAEIYSPALLQAEREYRLAEGDLKSAVASRLKQMGLTEAQIEALPKKEASVLTSQIIAPISGTVTDKKIYEGQYVQEGEKLLEIADFATMWFQFRAYEQDLPWIQAGQKVDVSTPSLPGRVVTGTIKFIDPNLDEATRAAKVRVELENPIVEGRRLFSHRLYADGAVQLNAPLTLNVPRSAVIQTGPEAIAFVDQGGGGFARRVLQLGRRGDALIEVLGGLNPGEKVVVNGNLLMDGQAEINRSYAGHAMDAESANAAAGLPALNDTQRRAVKDFLALADHLAAALAADDVKQFNAQATKTHETTTALLNAFENTNAWNSLVKPLEKVGHVSAAENLTGARKSFHPFSEASVALTQALRRADKDFAGIRVFRCPMTKDAFPGAPNRADWIQLQPDVRNPWFGKEMLDCGSEVKP